MFLGDKKSRIQQVHFSEIKASGVNLFIKREDELHSEISGNKYRKLAYNLEEAKRQRYTTLLTFGGAYSNHIAAAAAAGKEFGFKTIGVIRGDELEAKLPQVLKENPTLQMANEKGMRFHFVSRKLYRTKTEAGFLEKLHKKFGDFYVIPEGGTNAFAVKGCEQILEPSDAKFEIICCAMGTGGTISGIINSTNDNQKVIGFPSLKGDFLKHEVAKYVLNKENWSLNTEYSFGGYAKISTELVEFINRFKKETGIPLDPIYTGKMIFGIVDMIKKGKFNKGANILAIHTGGLQGIAGMNNFLAEKKLPQLI